MEDGYIIATKVEVFHIDSKIGILTCEVFLN
jgi:hypothetical protein